MQQLLLLTQISCLSPSPSICASLQGDLVHNKIFMKPWTGGAIGPHKLVQTQRAQTHTYKHTIYTEHSLSTHMVTSSTEEDYCYVSAASQKNNVNAESLLYKTTIWNKGLAYKRESNQTYYRQETLCQPFRVKTNHYSAFFLFLSETLIGREKSK